MKRFLPLILLAAAAGTVHAQSFDVTPRTGAGPFTITWDVPNGTDCQAAGIPDWSGAVAAAGTKQVTPAAGSASLSLVCSVPGPGKKGSLMASWTPATQNTDGSAYTDPKDVLLFCDKVANPTTQVAAVPTGTSSYRYENIDAGTWYCGVKSRNLNDITSDMSNIASGNVADIPTTVTWSATPVTIDVVVPPSPPRAPVLTITIGTQ